MSSNLPTSRVRTIMKSSVEAESLSQESVALTARVTELFVKHLARIGHNEARGKRLDYNHLANIVNTDQRYEFLTEIIPRKIKVSEFRKIMRKKQRQEQNNYSSSAESSSEDSNDSESERSSSASSQSSENSGSDGLSRPPHVTGDLD